MDPEREEEVLRAAELYYYTGLTQEAIAERLGCTRWTVGRLLEQGRASGMVTITIRHARARDHRLELDVERRFGLRTAIVVATQATQAETSDLVARMAAEFLTGLRPRPASIGMGWGPMEAAVARLLPRGWTERLLVFQAMGGPGRMNIDDIDRSIGEMARRGCGWARTISAPAVAPSSVLGRYYRSTPSVRATLAKAASADAVVFSPRSIESTLFTDPDDLELLECRMAVGSVLGHALDPDGEVLDSPLEERTTGLPLSALRRHRCSVAVTAGVGATAVALAALRGRLVRVLVTDTACAERILGSGEGDRIARDMAMEGKD